LKPPGFGVYKSMSTSEIIEIGAGKISTIKLLD